MKGVAIFDVGKTNKKMLVFDEQYRVVMEESVNFDPVTDDDGDPCEDLGRLTRWVRGSLAREQARGDIAVRAINFSAYGASFVHIGGTGEPVAPLYDYLKPYPPELTAKFYARYGGEAAFSLQTASPVLGSLNSGMQLYRIHEEKPELFARIGYALHLPQYLSFILTGRPVSDMTSIGCHTNLWNFPESVYHEWVYREGVIAKLAPIVDSTTVYPMRPSDGTVVGVGLHDSSAAVIPYLRTVEEPFALISTGTWCITINPFNISPLTASELRQDCLCYLSYEGRPMKASRLFAGHDHDEQVRRIAAHFNRSIASATMVAFDRACADALAARRPARAGYATIPLAASAFAGRQPGDFANFEEAYHCLLLDIMDQQVHSARLVLDCTGVRKILVDGGFSRNQVYMHLLAAAFPGMEVFAACVPQATAMGAAITIHHRWNKRPLPQDLIEWKRYPV